MMASGIVANAVVCPMTMVNKMDLWLLPLGGAEARCPDQSVRGL